MCEADLSREQVQNYANVLQLLTRTVTDKRRGWEGDAGWSGEAGIDDMYMYRLRPVASQHPAFDATSHASDVIVLSIAELRNPLIPVFVDCAIVQPGVQDVNDPLVGAAVQLQVATSERSLTVSSELASRLMSIGTRFRIDRVCPHLTRASEAYRVRDANIFLDGFAWLLVQTRV